MIYNPGPGKYSPGPGQYSPGPELVSWVINSTGRPAAGRWPGRFCNRLGLDQKAVPNDFFRFRFCEQTQGPSLSNSLHL